MRDDFVLGVDRLMARDLRFPGYSDGPGSPRTREVLHMGLKVIRSCRTSRAILYLACLLLCLAASCATPGKPYLVAPAVAGVIRGDDVPTGDVQLRLTVMHRESPTLFDRKEERLYPDGEFYFDQTQLVIAGHEYRKELSRVSVSARGRQRSSDLADGLVALRGGRSDSTRLRSRPADCARTTLLGRQPPATSMARGRGRANVCPDSVRVVMGAAGTEMFRPSRI